MHRDWRADGNPERQRRRQTETRAMDQRRRPRAFATLATLAIGTAMIWPRPIADSTGVSSSSNRQQHERAAGTGHGGNEAAAAAEGQQGHRFEAAMPRVDVARRYQCVDAADQEQDADGGFQQCRWRVLRGTRAEPGCGQCCDTEQCGFAPRDGASAGVERDATTQLGR